MDIAAWLRGIGFSQYEALFSEHAIDAELLPELTEQHLKDLGLPLGHRLKLLKEIKAISAPSITDLNSQPAAKDAAPGKRPTPELSSAEPEFLKESPPSKSEKRNEAERRQLTAVFCDLVDSTGLSEQLDPEEMSQIIRQYQTTVVGEVKRLGGHVANYSGDGVLACFGWPQAFDDSAERAVMAGLAITSAVAALKTSRSTPLGVRVGIATGLVVVGNLTGEGVWQENAVVGDTPNLAARLQGVAEPGTVVIAPGTRRLLGDLFEIIDFGTHVLKGIYKPVQVFRVVGKSKAGSRFEAFHRQAMTPLVGRDGEISLVEHRWQLAKTGEGQVVLLCGEAGLGKSRLTAALVERLVGPDDLLLRYFCSPHHVNSALHPVIEHITNAADIAQDDAADHALDKIESLIAKSGVNVGESAPLIARLLSIPTGDRYPQIELSPLVQKTRTLAALTNQIAGLARQKPMLMMLEDAHWLDPTSMEVFDLLIERIRGLPILLLITFRPEFRPRWSSLTNVTTLSLTRLGHAQCAAIVNRITGSKALPHKLLDHIIRKTDGVPLFVEELTRTILESELLQDSGGGYELIHPFSAVAIPSSLQDSLMARLDRLSGSREVAQIAACIGREFDYSLLYEVSNRRQDLNVALDQLEDSGLIFRKGIPPHAHYTFKHSLVQDVAYETLLKATRSLHHQRIAQVLESSSSELGTTDPELLAHHFWRAQLNDKAIHYGILAGRKAVTASGNLEAIDHFSRALELVKAQPESGQRDQQELDLLIALAVPMTSVKGYASTEVEKVYTRASQLCRRMGETPRLFPVLYGLWRFYLLSADYRMARDLGDQLLAMAHTFANPEFVLASNRAMGATLFYIGQLEEARNYLELVVATIPTADIRDSVLAYDVVDPWVASHAYNALSLWLLGYPDKARVEINKAISTAKEIGHPFSQALALCFATWTYQFCGDTARVGDLATEALILCKENSFQFWTGWAEILAAWAETRTLPAAACRERMKKGLIDWQATGSQLGLTYFQCLVAQAKPQDEASLQLNEAWIVAERTAEGFWQPEIQRLQGELHLGEPSLDLGQAEAFFTRALERARAMNARALELRICLSFARLFAKRNQSSRSLAMLENLLDWFSEGLDTSDLVEAHALRTAIRLEVAADPALKLMASG